MNLASIVILLVVAAAAVLVAYRQFFSGRRRRRSCCDCSKEGCTMREIMKQSAGEEAEASRSCCDAGAHTLNEK